MASVHDVAAYVLREQGPMTTFKLQKLVYYAQAWSLVWDEKPLFKARIEAWVNGPVVPALYKHHKGQFQVGSWPWGDPDALAPEERETVDSVLRYYGDKSGQWLRELTHAELPWQQARKGLPPGEPSAREIPHGLMYEYYSNLPG